MYGNINMRALKLIAWRCTYTRDSTECDMFPSDVKRARPSTREVKPQPIFHSSQAAENYIFHTEPKQI